MENTKKFCPCCSFDLNLFLPESEKKKTIRSGEGNDVAGSHSKPLPNISETYQQLVSISEQLSRAIDIPSGTVSSIVIVDTHGHAQLNRNRNETYALQSQKTITENPKFQVKALTCSVEPSDFEATLQYAASSDSILPALGVHPWYIENLPSSARQEASSEGDDVDGAENVNCDDEWLLPMEELLIKHPNCLVGEIGLCKIAKWVRLFPGGKAAAMKIQKRVFKKQMMLAAKLQRPVSVHCVNSHGIFVDVIKELVKFTESGMSDENHSSDGRSRRFLLPPGIAMHSFTGTAHHVKELLDLEHGIDFPNDKSKSTRKKKANLKKREPAENQNSALQRSPLFYFGFSHTVNYAMCTSEKSRKKGKEAVRAIPLDRLLVESDVHSDADIAGGTIGAISYVSWARDMPVIDVVTQTTKNGSEFFGSL